jgi:hypothetical protein
LTEERDEARLTNTTLETSLNEQISLLNQTKSQKDREVSFATTVSNSRYLLPRTNATNWKYKYQASGKKYLPSRTRRANLLNKLSKMQTLRYYYYRVR